MSGSPYAKLLEFPGSEHVRNVCLAGLGEAACRYLVHEEGRLRCGKNKAVRAHIDRRVREGTLGARGDNCAGIPPLLREERSSLIGCAILYEETMPSLSEKGILTHLDAGDARIALHVAWDREIDYTPQFSVLETEIEVTARGIAFSLMGAGAPAGRTTILFQE